MSYTRAPLVAERTQTHKHVWSLKASSDPNGPWSVHCSGDTTREDVVERRYKTPTTSSNGFAPTVYTHCSQSIKTPAPITISKFEVGSPYWLKFGFTDKTPPLGGCALLTGGANETMGLNSIKEESRLITEAFARLAENKVDMGVTLGESRKTAKTLVSLSNDLLNALVAVKRGDVKSLRRIFGVNSKKPSKKLAERWLQYQYGIKPMLNDVYGASQILQEGLENQDQPCRVKATRNGRGENSLSTIVGENSFKSKATYGATVRLYASLNDSQMRALSSLGLTDPAGIAWELVPFSFVVDWVVPIGTFIKAKNALVGMDYDYGCLSIKGSCSGTIEYNEDLYGEPNVGCSGVTGSNAISYKASGFTRTTIGPRNISLFCKNPFSLGHTANLAALLRVLKG